MTNRKKAVLLKKKQDNTSNSKIHTSKPQSNEKKPPVEDEKLTLISFAIFCVAMIAVAIVYKDAAITVTTVIVIAVLGIQYIIPQIREKKLLKAQQERNGRENLVNEPKKK